VPSVLIVILSWVLWFNTRVHHTSQHPGAPHSTTHHNTSLGTTLSALHVIMSWVLWFNTPVNHTHTPALLTALHVILSWVLWFNTRVNHTSQNPGAPHSTTRHHVVGLVVQHSGRPHTPRRSSQHYTSSCPGSCGSTLG